MIYLFAEIWAGLAVSLLAGLLTGWLLWGFSMSRIEGTLRTRLSKVRRNWEEVEASLAEALHRVSAMEQERNESERAWASRETEWETEKRELERRRTEAQERLESLESEIRAFRLHAREDAGRTGKKRVPSRERRLSVTGGME